MVRIVSPGAGMKPLLLAQKSCRTGVMASLRTLAQVFLAVLLGTTVGYSDSESVPKTEVSWAAPQLIRSSDISCRPTVCPDCNQHGGRLWSKTLIRQPLQEQLLNV